MPNPWDNDPIVGGGGGPVYGAPAKPESPPSGYGATPGGLTALPGGPADKPETSNLPQGWERPTPRAPAQRIPGLPANITDPQTEGGAKQTVDERTAAFLATRVKGGILDIGKVLSASPGATNPNVGAVIAGSIFGDMGRNVANSPDRQRIEAAQDDVLDAALTLGTGAAYSPEQLRGYTRAYFPQVGDAPETVRDKQARLTRLLEAAKLKAGASAPLIDEAIARLAGGDSAAPTFEQISTELKARSARGDDPAATIQWLISTGHPPTKEQIDQIIANRGNQNTEVENTYSPGMERFKEGVGGIVEGVGDALGIVSNPFIQGVNAIAGTDYNPDMGGAMRDAVGLPEASTDSQRLINAAGGAAMMGGGMAGAAKGAAPYAGEVLGGALSRFAAAPATDAAIAGASGGASEAARQAGGGTGAQIAAALAGGVAMAPIASRLASAATRLPAAETALTRAGKEEGVSINRAMVDPSKQRRVSALDRTLVGGPVMQKGMNEIGNQIEGRVAALGGDGTALKPDVMGQSAQAVAERIISTSGKSLGKRYDTLERATAGLKVPPSQSLQRVDDAIARLSEMGNTNKAEIGYLQDLKADLGKDLSVGALRRLRTTLRKKISKGELTFGEDEATVLSIMDTAAEDIATGLNAAGKPNVAAQFASVDRDYRQRMEFIKGALQKLVGKRGANLPPGQVLANLKAMTGVKGDNEGFRRFADQMTPEERSDMAATFADALAKNAKGEPSIPDFLKNTNALPESVRVTLFGPEGARSIHNLRTIVRDFQRVKGAMNGSPTALGNDWRSWLGTLMLSGSTALVPGVGLKAVGIAAGAGAIKGTRDYVGARLLMSPNIQKWLRSAPSTTNPKAINSHFDRLSAIAVREPALATEIQQLQQMIWRAANDNVTPGVAASQPTEGNQDQ